MQRYLVIANQTLDAAQFYDEVKERQAAGACTFFIVVPASAPREGLTWTEGEALAIAQDRLDGALGWFRELGAEVDGEVGDPSPFLAIWDAIRTREFDRIIISTLPAGLSRWLKMDLPNRARTAFGLPVSHIVAEPDRAGSRRGRDR